MRVLSGDPLLKVASAMGGVGNSGVWPHLWEKPLSGAIPQSCGEGYAVATTGCWSRGSGSAEMCMTLIAVSSAVGLFPSKFSVGYR